MSSDDCILLSSDDEACVQPEQVKVLSNCGRTLIKDENAKLFPAGYLLQFNNKVKTENNSKQTQKSSEDAVPKVEFKRQNNLNCTRDDSGCKRIMPTFLGKSDTMRSNLLVTSSATAVLVTELFKDLPVTPSTSAAVSKPPVSKSINGKEQQANIKRTEDNNSSPSGLPISTENDSASVPSINPNSVLFQKYVVMCKSRNNTAEMDTIISKLFKAYNDTDCTYKESEQFRLLLDEQLQSSNFPNFRLFPSMKIIRDELKFNKISRNNRVQGNHASESKNISNEVPVRVKPSMTENNVQVSKQWGNNMVEEEREEEEEEDELAGIDEKKRKQIKKLEKHLRAVNRAIKKLEEREVNWDKEDNSSYLMVDRYQRRFTQIYKKICELKNKPDDADRPIKRNISFRGSGFPDVDRCVEKVYNHTKKFPDFRDVLTIVKEVKKNEKLGSEQIHKIAEKVFKEFGSLLKIRRQRDDYDILCSYLPNILDPAVDNKELNEKLQSNFEYYKKKEEEVINSFVEKAEMQRIQPEEVHNSDCSEDEENENDEKEQEDGDDDDVEEEEEEKDEDDYSEKENGEEMNSTDDDSTSDNSHKSNSSSNIKRKRRKREKSSSSSSSSSCSTSSDETDFEPEEKIVKKLQKDKNKNVNVTNDKKDDSGNESESLLSYLNLEANNNNNNLESNCTTGIKDDNTLKKNISLPNEDRPSLKESANLSSQETNNSCIIIEDETVDTENILHKKDCNSIVSKDKGTDVFVIQDIGSLNKAVFDNIDKFSSKQFDRKRKHSAVDSVNPCPSTSKSGTSHNLFNKTIENKVKTERTVSIYKDDEDDCVQIIENPKKYFSGVSLQHKKENDDIDVIFAGKSDDEIKVLTSKKKLKTCSRPQNVQVINDSPKSQVSFNPCITSTPIHKTFLSFNNGNTNINNHKRSTMLEEILKRPFITETSTTTVSTTACKQTAKVIVNGAKAEIISEYSAKKVLSMKNTKVFTKGVKGGKTFDSGEVVTLD